MEPFKVASIWNKLVGRDQTVTIWYKMVGRVDGRWTIRAYDRNDRPLGVEIIANTPSELWKLFMLLNGYAVELPFDPDDKTAEINLGGVA